MYRGSLRCWTLKDVWTPITWVWEKVIGGSGTMSINREVTKYKDWFIKQLIIEHSLWARHYCGFWELTGEQNGHGFCLHGAYRQEMPCGECSEQTAHEEKSWKSELGPDHGRVLKRRQGVLVFTLSAKIHKLKCFQGIVRKCKFSVVWVWSGKRQEKSRDWGKLEIPNAIQSSEWLPNHS